MVVAIICPLIGYYARVRLSISFKRVIYIASGAGVIGGILWHFVMFGMIRVLYPRTGESLELIIISITVCYGIRCIDRRVYRQTEVPKIQNNTIFEKKKRYYWV
mgnify:CR=1 FL=1